MNIDIKGKQFGNWTVLEYTGRSSFGSAIWIARCKCGYIEERNYKSISRRRFGGCKECSKKFTVSIQIGYKYGLWEVIGQEDRIYSGRVVKYWRCICHGCGIEKSVKNSSLINHDSQKCKNCVSSKLRQAPLGSQFGNWYIVSDLSEYRHCDYYWKCKCTCGYEAWVLARRLTSGSNRQCPSCSYKKYDTPIKVNRIFNSYSQTAKSKNRKFTLTREQVFKLVTSECYYCGDPPRKTFHYKVSKKDDILTNGIDRIDSDLHYTIDNVVSCCVVCNRMKLDLSLNDFLDKIKIIYNRFK